MAAIQSVTVTSRGEGACPNNKLFFDREKAKEEKIQTKQKQECKEVADAMLEYIGDPLFYPQNSMQFFLTEGFTCDFDDLEAQMKKFNNITLEVRYERDFMRREGSVNHYKITRSVSDTTVDYEVI